MAPLAQARAEAKVPERRANELKCSTQARLRGLRKSSSTSTAQKVFGCAMRGGTIAVPTNLIECMHSRQGTHDGYFAYAEKSQNKLEADMNKRNIQGIGRQATRKARLWNNAKWCSAVTRATMPCSDPKTYSGSSKYENKLGNATKRTKRSTIPRAPALLMLKDDPHPPLLGPGATKRHCRH